MSVGESDMVHNEHIQPGRIVTIIRGRDAGKLAIIIGKVDEKFVLIADGDKRKFDRPKKKNILHLNLSEVVSSEVASSIHETGRVTNGKIRFALGRYNEERQEGVDPEKGGCAGG